MKRVSKEKISEMMGRNKFSPKQTTKYNTIYEDLAQVLKKHNMDLVLKSNLNGPRLGFVIKGEEGQQYSLQYFLGMQFKEFNKRFSYRDLLRKRSHLTNEEILENNF